MANLLSAAQAAGIAQAAIGGKGGGGAGGLSISDTSSAHAANGSIYGSAFGDFVINASVDNSPNAGYKTVAVGGLIVVAIYLLYKRAK